MHIIEKFPQHRRRGGEDEFKEEEDITRKTRKETIAIPRATRNWQTVFYKESDRKYIGLCRPYRVGSVATTQRCCGEVKAITKIM